eukprot:1159771-Pelagomonas_calceolata.AAC.5
MLLSCLTEHLRCNDASLVLLSCPTEHLRCNAAMLMLLSCPTEHLRCNDASLVLLSCLTEPLHFPLCRVQVAVLAALLFGEALTPASVLGLALGVSGLLLLELPEDSLINAGSELGLGMGNTVSGLLLLKLPEDGLVNQLADAGRKLDLGDRKQMHLAQEQVWSKGGRLQCSCASWGGPRRQGSQRG